MATSDANLGEPERALRVFDRYAPVLETEEADQRRAPRIQHVAGDRSGLAGVGIGQLDVGSIQAVRRFIPISTARSRSRR